MGKAAASPLKFRGEAKITGDKLHCSTTVSAGKAENCRKLTIALDTKFMTGRTAMSNKAVC